MAKPHDVLHGPQGFERGLLFGREPNGIDYRQLSSSSHNNHVAVYPHARSRANASLDHEQVGK
jgi:hypothetical protein